MRASEFLTAQEALWLVKVIFDQTYAAVNTSLQQRDQQKTAKTTQAAPRPKPTRTKVVVMPSVKPAANSKQKTADQAKNAAASGKMNAVKMTNAANKITQKPQRSLAPVKPLKPVGSQ
jgi:hypothetical protein